MYKITLCLNLKEKIYYISPIYDRLIICIECYITYKSVRWVAYSTGAQGRLQLNARCKDNKISHFLDKVYISNKKKTNIFWKNLNKNYVKIFR